MRAPGLPNVPPLTTRIKAGSEGGLEFSRICMQLLIAEYRHRHGVGDFPDDSAGDFRGSDATFRLLSGSPESASGLPAIIMHQFKFFSSPLSASHRRQIKDSYKDAIRKLVEWEGWGEVVKWVLITPEDFKRHDHEWLLNLSTSVDGGHALPIEHWGHQRIVAMMLENPRLAERYYPEFGTPALGATVVDRVRVAEHLCSWQPFRTTDFHRAEEDLHYWPEGKPKPLERITSDSRDAFVAAANVLNTSPEELYQLTVSALDPSPSEERLLSTPFAEFANRHRGTLEAAAKADPAVDRYCQLFLRDEDPVLEAVVANRTTAVIIFYDVEFELIDVWRSLGNGTHMASLVPAVATAEFFVTNPPETTRTNLSPPVQVPPNQTALITVVFRGFYQALGPTTYVSGRLTFSHSGGSCSSAPFRLTR